MDEKTIIKIFELLLDERDKRLDAKFREVRSDLNDGLARVHQELIAVNEKIKAVDEKMDTQTNKIQGFILDNNSAIADLVTEGLELTEAKVKKLESNTTLLKQG